jgi:hypothetical protein
MPGATTTTTPSLAAAPTVSPLATMPALGGLGETPGTGFGSPTYDPNGMLPSPSDTGGLSPSISGGVSMGAAPPSASAGY